MMRIRKPEVSWAGHLWVVAALPLVVVTGRALARGWLPVGDNAFFSIRASDVLTEHNPLLGAWSSGSLVVGVDVNNLGPLQLQLLALPVKFDWTAGTAIGVAAVGVGAIAVACLVARRAAGMLPAAVVAAAAAGLCWALGELVYEPRQHQFLVLPSFAYWVLAWAVASGHLAALPWAVAMGSLVLQTHLSYALLVPLLGAYALAGLAVVLWRQRRASGWVDRKRDALRWSAIAGVVALVCWAHPLVDQAFGRGNMSAAVRAAGVEQQTAGLAHGARVVGEVVAHPTWWFGASYRDFDPATPISSLAATLVLAGLAAVLAVVGVVAWRGRDRPGVAAVIGAVVALVGGCLAAASQPTEPPFGYVATNYRWLWSIAAFVWVAVAVVLVRAVARSPLAQRRAATGIAGVAAAFAVLAVLPNPPTAALVRDDERLMPVARDLLGQLDALDDRGPLLVERSHLFFAEPYTYVLMAGLQDRGIDWRVGTRDTLRFGERRGRTDDLAGVVRLESGDAAFDVQPGQERVALATLFTAAEEQDFVDLRARADLTRAEQQRLRSYESRWYRETVAVIYEPVEVP
jgi:hypothetical protein